MRPSNRNRSPGTAWPSSWGCEVTNRLLVAALKAQMVMDRALLPLVGAIRQAADWKARLNACRAYYRKRSELGLSVVDDDPYSSGILDSSTPIEWELWSDIRSHGLPFAPQYPVGRYVIDFADPKRLIAIECDGSAFHDADRDARRDAYLIEQGWTVYRTPGWACKARAVSPIEFKAMHREQFGELPDEAAVSAAATAYYATGAGFIRALAAIEFNQPEGSIVDDDMRGSLRRFRSTT